MSSMEPFLLNRIALMSTSRKYGRRFNSVEQIQETWAFWQADICHVLLVVLLEDLYIASPIILPDLVIYFFLEDPVHAGYDTMSIGKQIFSLGSWRWK
jgi:hypothetical protein